MDNRSTDTTKQDSNMNRQLQGNDKAPGEESGTGEQVEKDDLKGKKVDGDPSNAEDQPARRP